jgi:hypothetical protein
MTTMADDLMTGYFKPSNLKPPTVIPKQRDWTKLLEELRNSNGSLVLTDVTGKVVGHFILAPYNLSTVQMYRTCHGRYFRTLNKQLTLDM